MNDRLFPVPALAKLIPDIKVHLKVPGNILFKNREKGPPGGRFSPIAGHFLISDPLACCHLRKQTHLKKYSKPIFEFFTN